MCNTPERPIPAIGRQSKQSRRAPLERAKQPPMPSVEPAANKGTSDCSGRRCPLCETALAGIAETATPSDLLRRGILAIGTAQCGTCGQGWIYADYGDDTEAGAVRVELGRIASSLLWDSSEAESADGR